MFKEIISEKRFHGGFVRVQQNALCMLSFFSLEFFFYKANPKTMSDVLDIDLIT